MAIGSPPTFWWRHNTEVTSARWVTFCVFVGRVKMSRSGKERVRWRRFRTASSTEFGPSSPGFRRFERIWKKAPSGDLFWFVRARLWPGAVLYSELRRMKRPSE